MAFSICSTWWHLWRQQAIVNSIFGSGKRHGARWIEAAIGAQVKVVHSIVISQ
jgi:hypothetical protein